MTKKANESISASLLRRYTIHEAGHAVACVLLGRRLQYIELRVGRNGPEGHVICGQHPNLDPRRACDKVHARRMIEREVKIAWAGLAAEELFYERRDLDGLDDDAAMIDALLKRLERDRGRREDLGAHLLGQCRRLMCDYRAGIRCVATQLAARRSLVCSEVREMVL